MTREERAVAIVFLISFLYGLGIFMQSGVFMIPVPLFPVFAFVLTFYFALLHFKQEKRTSILLLATTFLEMCISPFFSTFFIKEESIAQPEIIDLIKFLSLLTLTIGLSVAQYNSENFRNRLLYFFIGGLLLLSGFLNAFVVYVICLSVFTIKFYFEPKSKYPVYLITLSILIFKTTEWVFMKFMS
ncbi:MAG: hypothetical protein RIT43_62 [Bacteroidota bacterium]|jgi:hypothetical protein